MVDGGCEECARRSLAWQRSAGGPLGMGVGARCSRLPGRRLAGSCRVWPVGAGGRRPGGPRAGQRWVRTCGCRGAASHPLRRHRIEAGGRLTADRFAVRRHCSPAPPADWLRVPAPAPGTRRGLPTRAVRFGTAILQTSLLSAVVTSMRTCSSQSLTPIAPRSSGSGRPFHAVASTPNTPSAALSVGQRLASASCSVSSIHGAAPEPPCTGTPVVGVVQAAASGIRAAGCCDAASFTHTPGGVPGAARRSLLLRGSRRIYLRR